MGQRNVLGEKKKVKKMPLSVTTPRTARHAFACSHKIRAVLALSRTSIRIQRKRLFTAAAHAAWRSFVSAPAILASSDGRRRDLTTFGRRLRTSNGTPPATFYGAACIHRDDYGHERESPTHDSRHVSGERCFRGAYPIIYLTLP